VPELLAFRGIRYRTDDLDDLTAPPYDVIDASQRAALAARSPHNAVHLILPVGADPYARAAADLARWQADGVLAADATPRLYGYEMEFVDDSGARRRTRGVVGALRLPSAAGNEDILPHERTLPKAKSDRLALLRATRANLDPIWALTPSHGFGQHLEGLPVLSRTTDDEGVVHTLTSIEDADRIAGISTAIAHEPLVLADGHHRFETAINYRNEREENGVVAPGDQAIMCLVAELADEQLWVQPIHRVLDGVTDPKQLRHALEQQFDVTPAGPNDVDSVRALEARVNSTLGVGYADADGLWYVTPKDAPLARARADMAAELADVGAAWFDVLAEPELNAVEVSYRDDAQTVAAMVRGGQADAAVLLRPVSIEQIRAAARAQVRMPQKTTFFAPKPRTGLVFRSLDLSA
jgi:uncharacterized protein (DUF1015 family)